MAWLDKPTIVIFSGRMQAGKDTCADHIVRKYNAVKYSYADFLKKMCSKLFNIPIEKLYGTNEDKNELTCVKWKNLPFTPEKLFQKRRDNTYLTIRELLQYVGTHIFRKMHYDCWANATMNEIIEDKHHLAVIADCRFPNELEIHKNFEEQIKKSIGIRLTRQINNDDDPSEMALDNYPFEYIIDNRNMTIEEQLQQVDNILEEEIDWLLS